MELHVVRPWTRCSSEGCEATHRRGWLMSCVQGRCKLHTYEICLVKKIGTRTQSQIVMLIKKEIEKFVQKLRTCGELGARLALLISLDVHTGRL